MKARLLALSIGIVLAVGLAAIAVRLLPEKVDMVLARLGFGPPLPVRAGRLSLSDEDCPPAMAGLTVTRDDGAVLEEPLTLREIGRTSKTAYATYSGHWAETRTLFFVLDQTAVHVDARFDTDYGDYVGSVDDNASRVHVHEHEICFELSVERLDGSRALETWRGRLSRD